MNDKSPETQRQKPGESEDSNKQTESSGKDKTHKKKRGTLLKETEVWLMLNPGNW